MTESVAALRNKHAQELRRLAAEHFQHDLTESDRDTLTSAAGRVSRHVTIGSLLGIGLGTIMAVRLRSMRLAYFNAFRAMERPVELRFADGRTAPVPDISDKLRPSQWGDAATFFFFGVAGLFLGGETGLFTGTASAARKISSNPESRKRIENAFRNYKIDAMKKQVQHLERKGEHSMWE